MLSFPLTLLVPNSAAAIESTTSSITSFSLLKKIPPCTGLGPFGSCTEPYYFNAMYKGTNLVKTPHSLESCRRCFEDILEEPISTEKMNVHSSQSVPNKFKHEDESNEIKGSHPNKGRVPWNKGRKHSEETRQKIRQRTREALKDPKVRKKMAKCPRPLSNRTKERIRASLMKLWGVRLQWKRSREKFFRLWAESIAIAAKVGGSDQQELDWDSYKKMEREIILQQLQQAAEKAKAKEMAHIQAERIARLKAEKMERIAQKRREREENAKVRGESGRTRIRRSKEEKEKMIEVHEVRLKERLMKIHKKKSSINQVSSQHQRNWERFNLDFAKVKQLGKEIPLADQIRCAKNKSARENQ